jgi:hypothetical protein
MKLTKLAILAALSGSLSMLAAPASAAAMLFSGGGAFTAGQNVSVDVFVSNLGPQIVSAYDLDVKYDGAMLSFFDVFFDLNLGVPSEVIEVEDGTVSGLLDFAAVSLLSDSDLDVLQGDSVRLATMQFTALTDGNTDSLEFVNWGPFNDVKGRNNEIIIGQVPEPASFGLLALALLGLTLTSKGRAK